MVGRHLGFSISSLCKDQLDIFLPPDQQVEQGILKNFRFIMTQSNYGWKVWSYPKMQSLRWPTISQSETDAPQRHLEEDRFPWQCSEKKTLIYFLYFSRPSRNRPLPRSASFDMRYHLRGCLSSGISPRGDDLALVSGALGGTLALIQPQRLRFQRFQWDSSGINCADFLQVPIHRSSLNFMYLCHWESEAVGDCSQIVYDFLKTCSCIINATAITINILYFSFFSHFQRKR